LPANIYKLRQYQLTKASAWPAQVSLLFAADGQLAIPFSWQKRRKLSSYFIHLRVEGRSGRPPPPCIASACHSASLHVVTRQTQVLAGRRATCPAQLHFIRLCSWAQSRTPARDAALSAFPIMRRIHGRYSSSGTRFYPTILRGIARRAVFRSLSSSIRGVQEDAHHKTQLSTLDSNSRNLLSLVE
jgi:hypothetical protein